MEEPFMLIGPCEDMEEAYADYMADLATERQARAKRANPRGTEDFGAMVARLRREAEGVGLRPGQLACETYWLVDGDRRLLGTAGRRREISGIWEYEGGHIGYTVRPSRRGKGHATRMLAMVLDRCRAAGMARVLVTCDRDNIASARVIQKNGGLLEGEVISKHTGKPKQRYWISL